jgi:hypothetical protein
MSTRRNKANSSTPAWKAAVEEAEEFLASDKNKKKLGKTRFETVTKKLTKQGTMEATAQEGKKFLKSSPKKAKSPKKDKPADEQTKPKEAEESKPVEVDRKKRERTDEESAAPAKKAKLVKAQTMEETARQGKEFLKKSKTSIPSHDLNTRAAKKATEQRRKKKSDS